MVPNPDFMSVVEKSFAKDAKLVLGCKSGGRSLRAAGMLEAAGYTQVIDQRAGFEGTMDPQGGAEPGWRPRGLPTSREAAPGRSYDALKAGRR